MIRYCKQDVTLLEEGVIAHGVNCQAVMGSGVAAAIRLKWPIVYKMYMSNGRGAELLGTMMLVKVDPDKELYVANCYTQVYYGNDGKQYADPGAIEDSIRLAADRANALRLNLYMPRIGCGLGGLDWGNDVLPRIERLANDYKGIDIIVCDL